MSGAGNLCKSARIRQGGGGGRGVVKLGVVYTLPIKFQTRSNEINTIVCDG